MRTVNFKVCEDKDITESLKITDGNLITKDQLDKSRSSTDGYTAKEGK